MKWRIALFSTLLFTSSFVYSQKKEDPRESLFVFDENWKGTTIEKAKYLLRKKKITDTCWQWDSYHFTGPLISTEMYKDEKGSIAHGRFIFYKPTGYIDSICHFRDGLAEGDWKFFNDAGRVFLEKKYEQGRLIDITERIKEDSMAQQRAKEGDSDPTNPFVKPEVQSMFSGNIGSWNTFLKKNLRYPQRALNIRIQGDVIVQFIVNNEGYVEDATIYKSVEYSLDEEALRIIRESKKWEPAIQLGKPVISYKKQPINFRLQQQ